MISASLTTDCMVKNEIALSANKLAKTIWTNTIAQSRGSGQNLTIDRLLYLDWALYAKLGNSSLVKILWLFCHKK